MTAAATPLMPVRGAAAPSRTRRLRAITGGAAGNFIEWFDWFLFVSFSLYFSPVFFPAGDKGAQLMQSAAVLALGFVMRPLGALVMGLVADRRGRRTALTFSVGLMCLGSLIIAFTPGYASIGIAAPILLLVARLAQGFSVGGEYGASATYISEMAGDRRRGFWSSFQCVTLVLGQLAALCLLLTLQALLPEQELKSWGWRLAFVIGALFAIVVFQLRRGLDETVAFDVEQRPARDRASLRNLISQHRREVLLVTALTAAGSTGFYAFIGYSQKFLVLSGGFSAAQATAITAASLIIFLLAQPLFGFLSDIIGRRRTLALSFGATMIATVPALTRLTHAQSSIEAWLILSALLLAFSGYSAIGAIVKAELFPTYVRALGVGLPYAVANAVFGGSTEFVALALRQSNREYLFYAYVAGAMAIGFAVSLLLPETSSRDLVQDEDFASKES